MIYFILGVIVTLAIIGLLPTIWFFAGGKWPGL
jgi:hypothetical protein